MNKTEPRAADRFFGGLITLVRTLITSIGAGFAFIAWTFLVFAGSALVLGIFEVSTEDAAWMPVGFVLFGFSSFVFFRALKSTTRRR